ncbi:MAG: FecR family protein [Dysgonamonadaceae bacterium]|nr:FecR family protein [Dysgonamonadaceae bacterium]
MKSYANYKCLDWLADDLFIKTMPSPTGKIKLYWQKLIDGGTINADEFISAISVLEAVSKSKPLMSPESKKALWKRISADCNPFWRSKKRQIIAFSSVLAAACVAGLLFFVLTRLPQKTASEINYADFQVINKQEMPDEIMIVSGNEQMTLDYDNPVVSYDQKGTLSVDQQTVAPETAENKNGKTADKPALDRISVPFGKRAQLRLSDGTMLWINSGTTVVYPNMFDGDKREIFVDGEIYADVQHNAALPFIVKTDDMEIRVLGTEFNFSAYKKDGIKEVVLVHGNVEVKQNGVELQLKPGQMYSVTKTGHSLKTVDTDLYTSWRNGIYIFEDEAIETVLLKLARYYNVTMVLPQQLSGISCYGKLELKDDLSALLNGLSQIASFNFAIKDNQYWIQFN